MKFLIVFFRPSIAYLLLKNILLTCLEREGERKRVGARGKERETHIHREKHQCMSATLIATSCMPTFWCTG